MKRTLIIASLALLLSACGGTTTLSLLLSDAPPDTSKISAVIVSLNKVEVHVVDTSEDKNGDPEDTSIDKDDKWQVVLNRSRQFDLIALQNDVTAVLGELELPAGKVTQIRLFIDTTGKNEVTMTTGETCKLDLTKVETKGIKINHPFKAIDLPEDKTTEIIVDFDLKESVSEEGDCIYKLKPVIKIKAFKLSEAK